MKDEEIRKLIDSFFNGESTEEEEMLLRAFFSGNDCPEGFEAEREYIRYCLENTEIKSPSAGFSKKILDVTVSTGNKVDISKRTGMLIYFSSAVAASVIIFLSVYLLAGNNRSYPDTYNDPEIAYTETMKILHEVAVKLNKGKKTIAPLGKLNSVSRQSIGMVNESALLINDSFSRLEAIDPLSSLNNNRKLNRKK